MPGANLFAVAIAHGAYSLHAYRLLERREMITRAICPRALHAPNVASSPIPATTPATKVWSADEPFHVAASSVGLRVSAIKSPAFPPTAGGKGGVLPGGGVGLGEGVGAACWTMILPRIRLG